MGNKITAEIKDAFELAEFLKTSREKAGLTQSDVAEALEYKSPQFISNWERGLAQPPIKSLKILAKLYKIDMDFLFNAMLAISIKMTEESMQREYKRFSKS